MVGVVTHERRHVEGRGQAGLTVFEQVPEALVRLLGGAESGELPHGPEPTAVHRVVDPARVRELAGNADLVEVGQVRGGVERLDLLARNRREKGVALGGYGHWWRV